MLLLKVQNKSIFRTFVAELALRMSNAKSKVVATSILAEPLQSSSN